MALLGLVLVFIGGLCALFPHGAWYLSTGWQFKDAEPSDLALGMQRIGGVIGAVIGVVILFSSCSTSLSKSSWINDFRDKLTSEQVASVSLGMHSKLLTEAEIEDLIGFLRSSEMTRQENHSSSLSYYTSFDLVFVDGSRETVYDIGGGHFQIDPSQIQNTKYVFHNSRLMDWIRNKE